MFCTGSLGAGKAELLAQMFSELKDRVYFIHLRNVQKDAHGNFMKHHLDGDVNMYEVMKVIAEENQKRETAIPFRPIMDIRCWMICRKQLTPDILRLAD